MLVSLVLFMITGKCSSCLLDEFFFQFSILVLNVVTAHLMMVSWVFWGILFTASLRISSTWESTSV